MTDVRDTTPDSPEAESDETALDLTAAEAADAVDTTAEDEEEGDPVVPSGRITLAAHHACLQGARAEIQDKLAVRQALAGKPQELAQR